ncbi:mitochondrial ribosomal protein subunit-domain-containing protein [Mycena pura]|uniref:Mitochondrial ribosomal protein subunit-domain-containing protein n=1 Tax=Mycena pura TaxID=153505 RepID=A0AAD6Y2U0_9AGAR|nr:mitochondrial ribosomal protein subunit-domain-containing protein [Mycena pura]
MKQAIAAAANASSHASTSALTIAARDTAPASPFAQLLRHSRFATFDPYIRKTYYSPKQFVERGYWGLKRPITQRKKNSFITIKKWEARQHYVEWDNAEDQVRFSRRMEELNVRPAVRLNTTWAMQMGSNKHAWLVDSEFCPHVWTTERKASREEARERDAEAPQTKEGGIPLNELGKRGPKAYGVHAASRTPGAVIPNVEAMSPSEFKRYLEKLRSLRPAFKEYLRREADREANDDAVKYKLLQRKSPLEVAQLPHSSYHRRFLTEHTEAEYKQTNKIQPQPHRNGALLYSHPSMLDSLFRNKLKPGIVLEDYRPGRYSSDKPHYIAAFAGVAARMSEQDAQAYGLRPLMNSSDGVRRELWPVAVAELRPITQDPLSLNEVPRVVGADPDEGLSGVKIKLYVTPSAGAADMRRANPYPPGSPEYIATEPFDAPPDTAARAAASGPTHGKTLSNSPKHIDPLLSPFLGTTAAPALQSEEERNVNKKTLDVLANLLKSDGTPVKVDDDEL